MTMTAALQAKLLTLPGDQSSLLSVPDHEALLKDLEAVDGSYPGGLANYVATAQRLLAQIQHSDAVAFTELRPGPVLVPPTVQRDPSDYKAVEVAAQALLRSTAFVLVAGGLGERLGFKGIKLSLPIDTFGHVSYMEHYATWIKSVAGQHAPLVLMTSDDTHALTVQLLAAKDNFGLENVTLLKQETVPCLGDSAATLCTLPGSSKLLRKPHGHGDVHHLLLKGGLIDKWYASDVQFVVFFQDTNAAVTLTVPQSLHLMQIEGLDMAFTCVPRQQGEAVGALASAVVAGEGTRRVFNIEYNVFDAAYKASAAAAVSGQDVGTPEQYAGSINTLLLRFDAYADAVKSSGGQVPEFINPKFADKTRTTFKSPTRVESLMQDIALVLPPSAAVKGILFDVSLYCPVKNNLAEGVARAASGASTHCAASGEEAVIAQRRALLRAAGVTLKDGEPFTVQGSLSVKLFPAVFFDATFAATLSEVCERFPCPAAVLISPTSTLVVTGDVVIEKLDLDGALILTAEPGSTIVVSGLEVRNRGWSVTGVDGGANEVDAIRGYRVERHETATFTAKNAETLILGQSQSHI